MRSGHLLIVSTTDESTSVVSPFRCLFCVSVDGCCPPNTFLDGLDSGTRCLTGPCSSDKEWCRYRFGQAYDPALPWLTSRGITPPSLFTLITPPSHPPPHT